MLRTSIVLWLFVFASGCDDLRQFRTGPDSVFRGEVVGSDTEAATDSFIRKGFPSHTWLEMRFNPNASGVVVDDAGAQPIRAVPGMLNAYACPGGLGDCSDSDRTVGPFDHDRLLSIDSLAHDTLSQYTFPGGGRLRNYIFELRFVSGTDNGDVNRDAMIFVSLMESDQIEVRAIASSVLADDGVTERLPALFGIFALQREHL